MNVPTAARAARASKIFDISDTSKRKASPARGNPPIRFYPTVAVPTAPPRLAVTTVYNYFIDNIRPVIEPRGSIALGDWRVFR